MSATAVPQPTPSKKPGKMKRTLQALVMMVLWSFAVFGAAGTTNWPRGWICLAAYFIGMSFAGLLVKAKNPGLLEQRANWRRKDTQPFDKIFLISYLPLTFIQPAIAGLDAVRFRWTSMPFATVYFGILLFVFALLMVTWTMVVNPFAESTVRIQSDRGHRTVTSGPYRIVRHPMYVGAMTMYFCSALIFGSWWALAVAVVIACLFIWRTTLEDRTLRKQLPGYEDFAAVTRYRLLPGIW